MKTIENNNKAEDIRERESEKNSESTNIHNKNSKQDISHETNLLIHQTANKMQKI